MYYSVDFDPFGNEELSFAWAVKIGGTGQEKITSMVVDENSNAMLLGEFSGTVDFDPSTPVYNLTASGLKDLFFLKLSPTGNYLFADNIRNSNSEASSLWPKQSSKRQFFLMGDFTSTVNFAIDPSDTPFSLTGSSSTKRTFIAKYSVPTISSRIVHEEDNTSTPRAC